MPGQPSFHEILEEKMTSRSTATESWFDGTGEFSSSGADPAALGSLLGHLSAFRWTPPPSAYRKGARPKGPSIEAEVSPTTKISAKASAHPKTNSPRPSGPPHLLNEEQKIAWTWFRSQTEPLAADFTRHELKQAFRRLALRQHPDVEGGSAETFMELQKCHQQLQEIFKKK